MFSKTWIFFTVRASTLQPGMALSHQIKMRFVRKLQKCRWQTWLSHSPDCFITVIASDQFSSVQFSPVIQLCPTVCKSMKHSMPGLPVHHQLPEFTQTHANDATSHIILCRPLLLLPTIPPSIRVFSKELILLMRWQKYWSFQLQHQSF